jgi:glycosyltransferase involved in cell wall biosynthesis
MKVVHVITRLILGGAQENTLYNCEDLIRDFGDDVTLITGPAEGPEGDLFERARRTIDVVVLPELRRAVRPIDDLRAYRSLVKIFDQKRPEVVHTHSSKAGILGRYAAWKVKTPAVVHTIHGLPFHPRESWFKNRLYVELERRAARRCHKIISVADAMTDQAVAAGVAARDRFITIYSGMEVDDFLLEPNNRDDIRAEFGIPLDAVVAIKVARLFEFKGHDDVIAVARRCVDAAERLHFLFVGGGVDRERLEGLIRKAGLSDRFHFTGLQPSRRIPELIHASDFVVHASYREGLARVLPQGLLAGKPVVSFDVDGAREVVKTGETGFLAPFGDRERLAEAIIASANDRELRMRLGAEGRERCRERFRHEMMTARIREVYRSILESTRSA